MTAPSSTINFSKIDLVIFDLDGTLIDSALDLAIAMDLAMKDEGIESRGIEYFKTMIRIGSKELIKELVNETRTEERVYQNFKKHYDSAMFKNTKLYPETLEVLNRLKSKSLTLWSNKREAPCKTILKHFKIDHYFKMILGGDSLPEKKPSPKPVFLMCEQLKIKPENTLIIGDSPLDLEAGAKAGTKTIGILSGLTPPDIMRTSKADIFINQIRDILPLLNRA